MVWREGLVYLFLSCFYQFYLSFAFVYNRFYSISFFPLWTRGLPHHRRCNHVAS
ncbi:hypothetical protein EX30DRAFT_112520 [Ascodesmis nigricans]|uniref:Uncharacterized protein n=1 Tax=Ascodesmis nigricans TaxID=341454 RepID=A0A4S2MSS2_9PEZI|nr:hypothetical protein EX30DRAFT_112520 [Ascodesmis nigricans]